MLEEEIAREKEARKEGLRKRKPVFTAKEKTAEELKGYSQLNMDLTKGSGVKAVESKVSNLLMFMPSQNIKFESYFLQAPVLGGGFWTDEDLVELTRLTKKYPNGTLSRWDVIAEHMNRSVHEVTFMAAKLKEPGYRPTDSVAETIVQEAAKKVKTIKATIDEKTPAVAEAIWSQEQQKLLETAIVKYPKTTVGDRWQKIANTVPGKTKEECLARYKYLVQKVKEQKMKETSAPRENDAQAQDPPTSANTDSTDRVKHIESPEETADTNAEVQEEQEIVEEPEPEPEPVIQKKTGGKPRNKRKERKKRMDFSSDEDDYYNE